ncbi:hypothetical protein LCGC14_2516770, partial [marine sediment metagenome]
VLMNKRYNKKIVIHKKIHGIWQKVDTDYATEIVVEGRGIKLFFLKRLRTNFGRYLSLPRIQTGLNEYWYFVGEDGEWINITLGDIDLQKYYNIINSTNMSTERISITQKLTVLGDTELQNGTAVNLTLDNLKVVNSPVNCPVNTGMIGTNMTTSTCSNNITDWWVIGSDLVYTGGNVGVGNVSPKHLLDVGGMQGIGAPGNLGIKSDSGAWAIRIEENSGVEGWHIGVDVDGDLNFDDSNTGIRLTFQDETGNIGIGTQSPGKKLEIYDSSPQLRIRDSGATASATTAFIEFGGTDGGNWNRTGYIGDGSSGDTHIRVRAEDSDLYLGDSSGEEVLVLSGGNATFSGNVGIGTVSPNDVLDVVGTIRTSINDTNYARFFQGASNGVISWNLGRLDFRYGTGGQSSQNKMTIKNDGNVGIGTSSPTTKLSVNEKSGMSPIGGICIKLTNKTGAVTVAGQLVQADTSANDAVKLTGIDEEETFGVFLDSGIAANA